MSEKMSVERAAEILDPKHRERYESLSELRFQLLPVWLF
jgi:hypothetical protein